MSTMQEGLRAAATMCEAAAMKAERAMAAAAEERYAVVVIETNGAGEELGGFSTEAEARSFAEDAAHEYHYGVAILRHEDELYDFGDSDGFVEWPTDDDDVQLID